MSSSTHSSGGAVPKGWRLQDIPNDELASLLKISRKEVGARRAALVQQQSDPAWVAATLDGLPAATLALLHVLIEAGGLAMEDELVRSAGARFGMSANDCRVASGPAISSVLMVPLRTRASEVAFGIVLPAGALIAPLVVHLDLHELPSAAFVAIESPARNPRMFLAACVASRHLDVKLTHEGRPHRGSIKRLARQVGLDEASLEVMLGTGLDLGMLYVEGELLRPDIEALAGAAAGRYPGSAAVAAIALQLAEGALSSAAIARSLQRRPDWEHRSVSTGDVLTYLPGFEVGTVGGVPAVSRHAIEGSAQGDVTPSFEVFLPPESRLVDVVHVGACCEWERLERVLVGRITKASISRAVTGGSSTGQILEQLAAACWRPIPPNVEAAIREWAGSVISATLATGRVIVVDPIAHARVASVLGKHATRVLAPGVFLVEEREELREVAMALTRSGIYHREVSPVRASPPRARELAPIAPAPGTARIRARVAAWRRGEPFEGSRDDFLDKHRVEPEPVAIATTGKSSALLDRWALQHDCRLDDGDPSHHGILPVLSMLPDREVANLLATSHDLDQLVRALGKVMARRRSPPALLWQRQDLRERLDE
ncbi:MAG TPA: hypothetical protein VHN14_29850, partial [Kofleriaceae bacterium]|nr:hypothetical protein [Kofleriaceae bacterium]